MTIRPANIELESDDCREIPCQACGGDGGWSYFTGGYSIHDGSADEAWETCNYCGGSGSEVVTAEPITLEDMEEAFGS